MSAADPEPPSAPVPEVPATARLAWLLFMRPLKLRRLFDAWGVEGDPTLWSRRYLRDKHIRTLTGRLLRILLLMGTLVPTTLACIMSSWIELSIVGSMFGILIGLGFGFLCATTLAGGFGVSFGIPMAIFSAITIGTMDAWDISSDRIYFVAILPITASSGIATDTRQYLRSDATKWLDLIAVAVVSTIYAVLATVWSTPMTGVTVAAMGFIVFMLFAARVPLFMLESAVTVVVALVARDPVRGLRAMKWLPFRHHDLIHFPLPGLKRVFIDLAEHSPNLARQLIDEASTTIAQKKPAQRAFDELQARALRQAAEAGAWLRVIELRGSFFPARDTLPPDDPLHQFIAAATDLHAAETGGSQHRRRNLLDKAAKQIDDIKKSHLSILNRRATFFADVASTWSQAIATRREALTREIEENPEIPNVYVVGPSLNPGDAEALQLFRARRDLITIIERDLDDTQRGVIFLVGQRRMGKTSLLAMLPTYLGTATTIVTCDFQGLSGSEHPRAPHRWVVQLLTDALARIPGLTLPALAVTDAWGSALAWLTAVDAELARIDHRALMAIDEVERLQDAVNEGRGDLAFLDFVRAAGDKLRRIRLLLVSAHPLTNPKLGRAWVDRLISVLPRTLGPLDPDDAEALLCRPVPTFPPDVFDEEAAHTILAHTGRHPYLIQAVGQQIVQRLLKDRRRAATQHDVERALDGVIKIAESALFTYLWDAFESTERDLMRALASGRPVDPETGTFRVLREQWFVDLHEGEPVVAFPLFARWIRDYRGEQPAA